MKILKIFLPACFAFLATGVQAQGIRNITALSWEISFPTGNTDFLNKTSLAGGRIEYRHMMSSSFSVGLAFSWNSFDQYVNTRTYHSPSGAVITTDMVRQIYTAPITAIAHYYPAVGNKMIKPFVGLGLGAQYAEQNVYFSIYQVGDDNWGFVVRPEIGTFVSFGNNLGALLTLSYNYSTNKNYSFKIDNIQQFGINIGIAGLF